MCMMSWSSILNDDVKQVVFEWYRKSLTEKIEALSTNYNWFEQIHRQISKMPYNWTCDEGFHKHCNEEFRKHCNEEFRKQFKLVYVSIGSVYVCFTFRILLHQIYLKVIRFYTFCATPP